MLSFRVIYFFMHHKFILTPFPPLFSSPLGWEKKPAVFVAQERRVNAEMRIQMLINKHLVHGFGWVSHVAC
jgi:hypothetical protein